MAKKRFVLSGYFGFKNFGDEAILSVIVNKLKEYGHKVTVLSSDPPYTKGKFKYIRSVNMFKISDVLWTISKTDFVISGGGSLLQDVTSLKSLLYYLFIIFAGLFFGKKVIIFAQGIGPINTPLGKFLTSLLLKRCLYVSVRDEKSFELLKKWGINAELLCDPIFSANVPEIEKTNTVAVQLRNCKNMNEDFIDRLAQAVTAHFSGMDIDIYSFQDSIDLDICKKFEKAVNLLNSDIKTTIYTGLTDEQTVQNLARAKYMVAMRFHALIVGLISGVKVLGINYDIKVEKLANEFEFPLVQLNKDFGNEFAILPQQNLEKIKTKLAAKNFNWDSFVKIINQE